MAQHVDDINDLFERRPGIPGHRLLDGETSCSCGGWTAPLGTSIRRGFDNHLTEVNLPAPLLVCKTSQCRVETFRPHSSKAQDQKCPACYGAGS